MGNKCVIFHLVTQFSILINMIIQASHGATDFPIYTQDQEGLYNITTHYPPTSTYHVITTTTSRPHPPCPSNAQCEQLEGHCLSELSPACNVTCKYGEYVDMTVSVLDDVPCLGERSHSRNVSCRFCYQMPSEDYTCSSNTSCRSIGNYSARRYTAECQVKPNVICLGRRTFHKNRLCHWTNGYSWTTTMLLSITLGGFGVDRFYLGHWKEGIGKLFSFGGLGVWTIIDVILISIGYISPGDGSLYTYRTNFTDEYYNTNVYTIY